MLVVCESASVVAFGQWGGWGRCLSLLNSASPSSTLGSSGESATEQQVPYDNDGVAFGQWKGREEEMIAYHLAAVEFQLAQIHAGWSIALALNRTFILPKVEPSNSSFTFFNV